MRPVDRERAIAHDDRLLIVSGVALRDGGVGTEQNRSRASQGQCQREGRKENLLEVHGHEGRSVQHFGNVWRGEASECSVAVVQQDAIAQFVENERVEVAVSVHVKQPGARTIKLVLQKLLGWAETSVALISAN